MAYPADLFIQTNVDGTTLVATDDHATRHNTVGSALVGITTTLGTNSGTSVLKNMTTGDFAARVKNETFGTSTWIGGTIGTAVVGTSSIIGGTVGTAYITGGTITNVSGLSTTYTTIGTSNADYITDGTDDDVQFNSAISAIGSTGGGVVFVKPGTYTLNGTVTLANNVTLEGNGAASVLTLGSAKSIYGSALSNITIRNLKITASAHGVDNYAIRLSDCSDVFVENNNITCGGFGIFVDAYGTSERVYIKNNYCLGLGNNDVIGGGCQDSTNSLTKDFFITGNFVQQTGTAGANYTTAIDFVRVNRTMISNNIVKGNIAFGGEQYPHVDSIISNNILGPAIGTTYCNIDVNSKASGTISSRNIEVTNNILDVGFISFTSGTGLGHKNITVTGNNVNAGSIRDFGMIFYTITNGIINSNIVGSSLLIGCDLENSGSITLIGNRITNTFGTGSWGYAFREYGTTNYNAYVGNVIRGNSQTGLATAGANNVVQNNVT